MNYALGNVKEEKKMKENVITHFPLVGMLNLFDLSIL